MGFSETATQVIFFMAVLIVSTFVVVFFNDYSREAVDSANIQRQQLSEKLKTSASIDIINFDDSTNPDTINAYVKNTGLVTINYEDLDLYVDNVRIPRDNLNRTIQILADTDTTNVGVWDSKEVILVQIFYNLTSSTTHTVDLVLSNGIRSSLDFST
ncbi:hypothetical protein JXM83_03845 [Candidatus Woesearchaeota archaeon]|nr:hypothetical protein [Candidatus Woesearchaeota archaeon]